MVRERGQAEVAELCVLLGVSPETLRRDLRALAEQGLVRRSYGRAYPVESGAFESSLEARRLYQPEEKARIAAHVVSHIARAATLFIDEGYTMELVAQRLPTDRPFTVVTAALPIATLLAPRLNVEVILLGGRVRGNTLGVVDRWAVEMLERLNLDLAILGANGISVRNGVTTPDPAVADIKAAAVRRADRSILIGAHHKFGRRTFVSFAGLRDFEVIVTGRELGSAAAERFEAAGATLRRV